MISDNFKGHPDQKFGYVTYAQHGDDLMIANLFDLLEIKKYRWLDLGAHHPIHISNTALSYSRGMSGVNVEANHQLMHELETRRPRDINVNLGVGLKDGKQTFYMYSNASGRNTFCPGEVQLYGRRVEKEVQVDVLTVNEIVTRYCDGVWPELLLTDLEGLDYDVLESADFSHSRPKIIVTEVRRYDTHRTEALLASKDFHLHCRMGENLFFIDNEFYGGVY